MAPAPVADRPRQVNDPPRERDHRPENAAPLWTGTAPWRLRPLGQSAPSLRVRRRLGTKRRRQMSSLIIVILVRKSGPTVSRDSRGAGLGPWIGGLRLRQARRSISPPSRPSHSIQQIPPQPDRVVLFVPVAFSNRRLPAHTRQMFLVLRRFGFGGFCQCSRKRDSLGLGNGASCHWLQPQ
jgi:hypothetical protein